MLVSAHQLEALKPKLRPKYIFSTAFDRVGRDMADCVYIGHQCRRLKVGLWIGDSEFRLDTFAQRMTFVSQSISGDAENEGRSQRAKNSWARRRREGKPTSNKVPYGLQLRGEFDVAIPESAQWVLNAFEWYAKGIGMHTIGLRMEGQAPAHTWLTTRIGEDGERIEKTRLKTHWESNRVGKLLRQRRYRGTVVPSELFDAVQHRLENTPKSGSRTQRQYPLSGAMRCKDCGRHLHGQATGHSSTYFLADGTRKHSMRTPLRYYACQVCHYRQNAERLEKAFFSEIGRLTADESLLKRWIATPQLGGADMSELRKHAKRLESECDEDVLRTKRDRLVDVMMTSSMGSAEFERQLRRLEDDWLLKREQLVAIENQLEGTASSERNVARIRHLLMNFTSLYEVATYEEKREMLAGLAEALGGLMVSRDGLIWSKNNGELRTISPKSLTETWSSAISR